MSKETVDDTLVIPKEIYLAFHPIEQIMAQTLLRVGKVKILYNDPKFQNLLKNL